MISDLDFVGDKVPSLFPVSGDDGTGHRKFYAEFQFDGGIDNGIEAKDFFGAVRILRVSSDTDSGIEVGRHFGTTEGKGVGCWGVGHADLRNDASLDDEIEPNLLKRFLDPKNLVEDARFFRIGLFQAERKDFHLWSFDPGVSRKSLGRTGDPDSDIPEKRLFIRTVQTVENSFADIFKDAGKRDTLASFFKPGASSVTGMGRKERSIGGDDLIGEEPQQFGNLHQDVEDLVVTNLPQPPLEIGEGGLARDMIRCYPSIKTVMLSPFSVPEHFHKAFHIGEFFNMAEEIQKKEADRIVGNSGNGIRGSDQGADE